jgi:hypothetical protein
MTQPASLAPFLAWHGMAGWGQAAGFRRKQALIISTGHGNEMHLVSEIPIKITWQIVVKFCVWCNGRSFLPLSARAGVVHVIRGPPLHCRSPFLESWELADTQQPGHTPTARTMIRSLHSVTGRVNLSRPWLANRLHPPATSGDWSRQHPGLKRLAASTDPAEEYVCFAASSAAGFVSV